MESLSASCTFTKCHSKPTALFISPGLGAWSIATNLLEWIACRSLPLRKKTQMIDSIPGNGTCPSQLRPVQETGCPNGQKIAHFPYRL